MYKDVFHPMEHDGSRNGRTSFSPSNRSPDCSDACFLNACRRFSRPGCWDSLIAWRPFLGDRDAFTALVQAMRRIDWVVYAKKPFGDPAQVLAYLGLYTH